MAIFEFHKKANELESELAEYGITYCEDRGNDQLIIAPKLKGDPCGVGLAIECESHVEMLDYLKIGPGTVGVSYSFLGGMLMHYFNGHVPEDFPISYVRDLFMLGVNDPEGIGGTGTAELEAALKIHHAAYDVIASAPPLPPFIIQRIRAHVDRVYNKQVLH